MAVAVRVAVLADTHLRDSDPPRRDLPGQAWERIRQCDVVLHAGDVIEPGLLRRLNEVAPTHAVLGNNDQALIGHSPRPGNWSWPVFAWRWSTTAGGGQGDRRGYGAGSPMPRSSCSATATSPATRSAPTVRSSSTRARPRPADHSRRAPWASSYWPAGGSSSATSSPSADQPTATAGAGCLDPDRRPLNPADRSRPEPRCPTAAPPRARSVARPCDRSPARLPPARLRDAGRSRRPLA